MTPSHGDEGCPPDLRSLIRDAELPWLLDQYQPWQHKRLAVPQGMTGWWQITGRSDKPMHLNTQDDMYYIKNYSIWLDIKIILKTVSTVISGRGAY